MPKKKHAASGPTPESIELGYETRDIAIAPLVWNAAALVILCAAVMVAMLWLLNVMQARKAREDAGLAAAYPLAEGRRLPPEPRLRPSETPDVDAMHAREDAVLNSMAWVNKDMGIARIPIDRAIEIVSQKAANGGPLPYWTPPAPPAGQPNAQTAAPAAPVAP